MRSGAALVLSVALAGCASPPPAAWPRAMAGFDSEAAVLAEVRRRLAALGVDGADTVEMVVEPGLLLAYYRAGVIHMRPVFGTQAETLARLDKLLRGVFGDRADQIYEAAGGRAEAARAFAELGVLAIGHEVFHYVRLLHRSSEEAIEPYDEETLAIRFELALLHAMIDERVVDRGWLERYERFQRALLGPCPDGDHAPPSASFDAIADESFEALVAITRGEPNPAPDKLERRTCLYADLRVGLITQPREGLAPLVERLLVRTPP